MGCIAHEPIHLVNLLVESLQEDMHFTKMHYLRLNQNVKVIEFRSRLNGKSGRVLVGNHMNKIIVDVLVDGDDIRKESTPQVVMQDVDNKLLNPIVKWLKEYANMN